MKKLVLLITVLFVSVISTACINNLAVQELNSKAKEYMANGETEKAICRLRSSIDLDTSIFETHYNLGIALIDAKEYDDAQASLQNAIKLKPDFADSYYSLGLALENEAEEMINPPKDDDTDDCNKCDDADSAALKEAKKELTDEEKNIIVGKYNEAIDSYNNYLSKKPSANDKAKVEERIAYLNTQIGKFNSDKNSSISDEMKSPSSEE